MSKTPQENTDSATPATMGQAQTPSRDWRQDWMKELPTLRFPQAADTHFPLIRPALLEKLKRENPQAYEKIKADIDFMDYELLRLFRDRDYEAKKQQNRYRLFQLGFLILAALATMIGSFQALSLANAPDWMPIWAFVETIVALLATFLATISGRESPMPIWLNNRRRAEQMRREYFRFLMNMPPYDKLDGYERKIELSRRAADINRGVFPEEPTVL